MKRHPFYSALLSASLVLIAQVLVACGPTARVKLPPNTALPTHLALLPSDFSIDIPKERIELVRGAVLSELRNRNFIVADDKIVNSTCSSPKCPEMSRLAKDYLIDGFATLKIESFSKTSFLAGYYNELAGSLSVSDRSGKELIAIDHTESERGGLIFNSGQVIQGIISQVNNSGDAAYKELSSQFAKTIVEQLPAPEVSASSTTPESLDVVINSADASWSSPTSYTVCVNGTPKSLAAVIVDSQRASLREIKPGRYCGAFSSLVAPASANGSTFVELRTAYGYSERKAITLPTIAPCELDNRIKPAQSDLAVSCSVVGDDLSRANSGCSKELPLCKADKIVLYSAATNSFSRAAESRRSTIKLPDPKGSYEVVAIGAGGIPSVPVRFPESVNSSTK